jgi:hypothetical protein
LSLRKAIRTHNKETDEVIPVYSDVVIQYL